MRRRDVEKMFAVGTLNIGDTVWICAYQYNDPTHQPVRHVRPSKAIITAGDKTPDNKNVIMFPSAYLTLVSDSGKNKYVPFANNKNLNESVEVFDNEKDCKDAYVSLCESNKILLTQEKQNFIDRIDARILEAENDAQKYSV